MSINNLDLPVKIIGWVGPAEILLPYGMNSYQKIRSDFFPFLMLNLTGGMLLMFCTSYKEAFADALFNLVWIIVVAVALVRLSYINHLKTPQL